MRFLIYQIANLLNFLSFIFILALILIAIAFFLFMDGEIQLWYMVITPTCFVFFIATLSYLRGRITFGVYKGMFWEDIPQDYLLWLMRNHKDFSVTKRAKDTLERLKPKELSEDELAILKQYGDDFEKMVGIHYEEKGYEVEYRGLELGLKDGGIDLVATKNNELILIQCKYWKKKNSITPKMVKEFYGSCHFYLDDTKVTVAPICIYAVAARDSISFSAYQLFKDNYVKCRYQVFNDEF